MANFVDIGKYHINLDYVVTVSPAMSEDSDIWIELSNGQQVEASAKYFEKLVGMNDKQKTE